MSFFKAYDMRGTFGADFDLDTVYRVGLALPQVVKGRRWLVGRDCRTTSDAVHDALVKGLSEAGAEVSDLGLCTTPMVYFFTAADGFDGSVMITASHNPPSDNGLKVSKATALPVGYANGLNEVERLVGEMQAKAGGPRPSVKELPDALSRYVAWQKGRCGDFVQPDYLVPVVARATLGHPAAQPPNHLTTQPPNHRKIIHDVRTSRGAIETLREDGFEPVMVPVGHAFAKPILRECGALCGGELAGHYYFSEFFGCDSGLLAATRILSEVAKAKAAGKTFSEMMKPIVSRYANSGELNFRVEDKDAAIARVLAAAAKLACETGRSEMDGVRLEFDEGWISVRKSNTEPYLRLLVECRTEEELNNWVGHLSDAIAPHNHMTETSNRAEHVERAEKS